VIGKGIIRFHAVHWPAILLSAGEPLPTTIFVHDYLTVDGQKLSKSHGASTDPAAIAARYGTDALRWWLIRDVPRSGDADFREELLAARADELADDLGNLVNRTVTLVSRFRPNGIRPTPPANEPLLGQVERTSGEIDEALDRFDFRAAAEVLWSIVTEANRFVSRTRPWELAKGERSGDGAATDDLDAILVVLVTVCHTIARELTPFLPEAAARIEDVLDRRDPARGRKLFAKAETADAAKPR
jgi:methionyl-tRNA synthetase